MTRWETYRLLCRLLARCCDKAEPHLDLAAVDWPALIEASSHHLVTPALAWCMADDEAIPPDVRDYLQAALALNTQRNEMLLDVLESIVRALNSADITPVLLKGAAALAEPLYPHVGARMLADLDLLVARERTEPALQCLREVGFVDSTMPVWVESESHHLPMYSHPDKGVGVDLHVRVVVPRYATLVPTDEFVANATPCGFRGLSVLIPNPTARIAHNIVHSQLYDGLHLRGIVSLRHLLDLAMLSARPGDAIQWTGLDALFRAAGYGSAFNDTIAIAQFLFGYPALVRGAVVQTRALDRLRRAVEQPGRQRWGRAVLLGRRFLHGMRTPRGPLNLLDPRTWPRRLQTVTRMLRTPKW